MADWPDGIWQGLPALADAVHGLSGWGAWGVAVAAGAGAGSLLGRWSLVYADRLAGGAPATARTLWGAAAESAARPWQPARDTAMAAVLGLVAGLLAAGAGPGPGLVPLALALAALGWIDARSGLLPDAITLPLMAAGWLLGVQGFADAVVACALMGSGLAGAACLYRRVRGRDGFGGGDVKCMAALAGWLGLETAVGILWLACVLGVAASLGRRGGRLRPYPFGPCIALAAGAWMLGCP